MATVKAAPPATRADRGVYFAKKGAAPAKPSEDAVAGVASGAMSIDSLEADKLPADLKAKSKDELRAELTERAKKREQAQKEINDLAKQRDEYLKAEDLRRDALSLVSEFLSLEATPEDHEKLRQRFHIPYPAVLEEEIERQVRAWLGGLSNAFLAGCDSASIRELVFSELRSWC